MSNEYKSTNHIKAFKYISLLTIVIILNSQLKIPWHLEGPLHDLLSMDDVGGMEPQQFVAC